MQGEVAPRITKLDTDNYLQWSIEIEHTLRLKGCWEAVAPPDLADPLAQMALAAGGEGDASVGAQTGEQPSSEELTRMERQAMSLLVLSVKPHHMATIRRNPTAHMAWEALGRGFRSRGPARMINLRRELSTMRMGRSETVLRYFNRGKTIAWELQELGAEVDDNQLMTALLVGVHAKYELTATVLASQAHLTLDEAQESLQAAEVRPGMDRKTDRSDKRDVTGSALVIGDKDSRAPRYKHRKDPRCYQCNKKGHYKRDCPSAREKSDSDGGSGAAGLAMMATVIPRGITMPKDTPSAWVIDSGASHHMTGDKGALTDVAKCDPVAVELADERTRVATSSGTARMSVAGVHGETTLTLSDVLLVPGLSTQLFSVRQASARGYRTEFDAEGVVIKHGTAVKVKGKIEGKMYVLPTLCGTATANAASCTPSAELWHRRFAHLGAATLDKTARVVTGIHIDAAGIARLREAVCPPCIEGKMTRAPFPASTSKTTEPLQLVHTDVCGPMPLPTPAGNVYLVTLIDDNTRFKAVIPVKTKGNAKDAVMAVLNLWSNQLNKRVIVVRTDGGMEYTGKNWDEWLHTKGITHQASNPYTPAQNGVAERYNRVIVERTMAMLADSHVPKKYWAEAAVTVNYLANRVPQRNQEVTPYEAFYNKRPDVSHLRTFGCRAWVYTPKDIRGKLQPRAQVGLLLGYGKDQKGYRVLVKGRVISSRGVKFEEATLPSVSTPKEGNAKHDDDGDNNVVTFPLDEVPEKVASPTTDPTETDAPQASARIDNAVAAARQLFGNNAVNDNNGSIVGEGEESTSDSEPTSDDDSEAGEAEEPASRHPSRLRRANPTQRGRATTAWIGTGPPIVGAPIFPHTGQGRAALAMDQGQRVKAWAMAAKGGRTPDKMRIHQARKEPDWPLFDEAVCKEVDSLWRNRTWELTDLPPGKAITDTEMLCERKRGATGKVERHKGRFVARGDKQTYLVDFNEVWAPVARHATMRTLLAMCAAKELHIRQLDIETAFLNGEVEEEIYVRQPRGYERGDPSKVCRLLKALYGLKQAARAWYQKLTEVLKAKGMAPCDADPCLFKGIRNGGTVFILVYVDDLLIVATSNITADAVEADIMGAFTARRMGEPTFFLGLHIDRNKQAGTIALGQRQYVSTLLERFGMEEANPVRLPMGVGSRLRQMGEALAEDLAQLYQELVGALLYIATCTRPDISFAVGQLSRHVAKPTTNHLMAAKAVLRYLKGTRELAINYGKAEDMVGYSDADYAGDLDTRLSTTGYIFTLNGAAVSWASKRQATVSHSTTEAEYVAAAMAVQEAVWLRRLLHDLTGVTKPMVMRCDNQSALAMMRNAVCSARTKHIDVAYHFLREKVHDGELLPAHVPTGEMVADMLTKALPIPSFSTCRQEVGVRSYL